MEVKGEYVILGRCLNGVRVNAYVIKHTGTGVVSIVSKKETEYMAEKKQIINCTGQVYGGKILLKGTNCKLVDLPNYDLNGQLITKDKDISNKEIADLKIVARIVTGKNTVGYVIYKLDSNGNVDKRSIEREKVLVLAREGKIVNARVQMFNSKPLLRGVKCELAQLPVVRV